MSSKTDDASPTVETPTDHPMLASLLERIAIGAVGLTTRALAEAQPGLDLTFPQWRAILILGEGPDGARIGEVAARVGVTLPATSRLLHRLEARGLLVLSVDERDRRATRARLTRPGEQARAAILAHRRLRIAAIAERVPDGVRQRLIPDLAIIADQFESYG